MAIRTHRSNSCRSRFHHRRSARRRSCRSTSGGPTSRSASSPRRWAIIDDEQLAQALAEQFGMKMVYLAELQIPAQVLGHGHRGDGPALSGDSDLAGRQHADDRHVRSAKALDPRRIAHVSRLRHPHDGGHRARHAKGARQVLFRRHAKASRASWPTWRPTRSWPPRPTPLAGDGPIDLTERRGPGRQRAGAQAAEHGLADGDQRQGQRLALRAVRG